MAREPMKPRIMYLWNDPASNKMLSIILRDLSPVPGGRWRARRVRVTDASDPVAKAERAVVKAARTVSAARQGSTTQVVALTHLSNMIVFLDDALRAAKRRRP